jgi:sterol desaturase/sphingolipid hydroxylase (fatty acid hydroxylase superfamily)
VFGNKMALVGGPLDVRVNSNQTQLCCICLKLGGTGRLGNFNPILGLVIRQKMIHYALAHAGHFFHELLWRVIVVFAIYLIGFMIESSGRLDDSPNRKGVLLNSIHVFVFQGAALSVGVMTGYYLKLLVDKIPSYRPPIHFRGGAFEVVALTFSMIATQDLFYYWLHRFQHTSKWLWAEHELHHSEEHINVTTTWRHHWLDTVLAPLFIGPPVFLLFDTTVGIAVWVILFSQLMPYFVHLDSRIRFGWFNYVLSSPQSHRIHHSKAPEHMDKNFAVVLPLWDIIFGTYYHPKEGEWPSTGVEGVRVTSLGGPSFCPSFLGAKCFATHGRVGGNANQESK